MHSKEQILQVPISFYFSGNFPYFPMISNIILEFFTLTLFRIGLFGAAHRRGLSGAAAKFLPP